MAKAKPSQQKRARERARQERQKEKTERRLASKARRADTPRRSGDEDPDIAGIVPGPQPPLWEDEEEAGETEAE